MLRTVNLPNKPLCMVENDRVLYIGDARGNIFTISLPEIFIEQKISAKGPISAICFHEDRLFYGTWDGILYCGNKEIKLGRDPVKCICTHKDRILASVDTYLLVLDLDLNIVERHEVESKIHSMGLWNNTVYLGNGLGEISIYENEYQKDSEKIHDKTILCIRKSLTGSADGTVKNKKETIFKGISWIRSIYDENLFSSGKDVIKDGKILYSHEDDVMNVTQIGDLIVSIGLDYCLKIFSKNILMNEEEEKELLKMLES